MSSTVAPAPANHCKMLRMKPLDLPEWPYPRWIAHRGAGKLAPENTLAAFRLGASQGYRSSDDTPFLLHDDTLQRTTNARAVIGAGQSAVAGDHPWGVLAQLDAGRWHSRGYAGEPIPSFANIARYCIRNGLMLNIEIKPTSGTALHTGAVR